MPKIKYQNQIEEYLADQEFSETTKATYRRDLLAFFKFSKGKAPTVDNARAWLDKLESKERTPSYINRCHYALKGFCQWMGIDIFAAPHEKSRFKVRAPRMQFQAPPRTRSIEEVESLFKACKTPLDNMLMMLLASTGSRISELMKINIDDDIDWESGTISLIRKGRRGRKETIAVSPETLTAIKGYLDWRESRSDLLLPFQYWDLYKSFKDLAKRAGVEFPRGSFFHNLRHFFVFYQKSAGIETEKISSAVGHSSKQVTDRMYGVLPPEEIKRQLAPMPWEKGDIDG